MHKFPNLSWITEINELFHNILIYWDAPVYTVYSLNVQYTSSLSFSHKTRLNHLLPWQIPPWSFSSCSAVCRVVDLCWIVWWSGKVLCKSSCRWLLAELHFNVSCNDSLTQVRFNLWLRSSSLRHEDLWHKRFFLRRWIDLLLNMQDSDQLCQASFEELALSVCVL